MDTNLINKIANHPLQTSEWKKFREAWGNKILETKYGIITIHKLPFLPYSIGIFEKGSIPTKEMLSELRRIGKENKLIFIKLEPNVAFSDSSMQYVVSSKERQKSINILTKNGCVKGKTLFTPTTFWIDITKSEDELLKSFSSKTRYNIRLAQKKGVVVKEDNSDEAFQKYLDLTFETTHRQGFYAHTPSYHKLMWKFLHQQPTTHNLQPIAHLLTATYNGEVITTWVLFAWKEFLYYPYGASTDKHKDVMANNLMMWEAIRFGKKLGCKTFDLWGREEGKGFTKFKEGYNPQVIEFLGSWDLVISKTLYSLYRTAEKIRWYLLRLKSRVKNFITSKS
jgi:lipid II:glycine glycyltransferase (peptidoglycan interpeptide bridge formation enzyme)